MTRWQGLYDELTTTRYPALFAYAAALTGDRDSAHDVVREALLKVFASPRRLRSMPDAESRVRRAIAAIYVDDSRRAKVLAHTARRLGSEGAPTSAGTAYPIDDVTAALAELSPKVRTCIMLRYHDDLTVAQIADRLGMSQGTVKRHLSEGAQALRAPLGTSDEGDEPEAVPVIAPKDKAR